MTTYNEFTKVWKHASAFRYRLALHYAGGVFYVIRWIDQEFSDKKSLKKMPRQPQPIEHWVGQVKHDLLCEQYPLFYAADACIQ